MIGKWHRYHPASRKPASHMTEQYSVAKFSSQRRRRKSDRLIAIRLMDRSKPCPAVKYRRMWTAIDKVHPSCIRQWVDLIDLHCDRYVAMGPGFSNTKGLARGKALPHVSAIYVTVFPVSDRTPSRNT